MNRAEACDLFGFENTTIPPDVIEDAFEEEFFSIKQYFLMNPVIASLFRKRIEKLQSLEEARGVLLDEQTPEFTDLVSVPTLSGTKLMTEYNQQLSLLKTKLSSAVEVGRVTSIVEAMIAFQKQFDELVLSRVSAVFGEPVNWGKAFDRNLKLSEGSNTIKLQQLLSKQLVELSESEKMDLFAETFRISRRLQLKS